MWPHTDSQTTYTHLSIALRASSHDPFGVVLECAISYFMLLNTVQLGTVPLMTLATKYSSPNTAINVLGSKLLVLEFLRIWLWDCALRLISSTFTTNKHTFFLCGRVWQCVQPQSHKQTTYRLPHANIYTVHMNTFRCKIVKISSDFQCLACRVSWKSYSQIGTQSTLYLMLCPSAVQQCPSPGLGCCLVLHHPSSPACLLQGDKKSITTSP